MVTRAKQEWRRAKARRLLAQRSLNRAAKALALAKEDEMYAMSMHVIAQEKEAQNGKV